MKKLITVFTAITVLFSINSCQKENAINVNGEISEMLVKDPLFEKLDQATYETDLDMLKYGGEKISIELDAILKQDIKNKKVKSFREFYTRKEEVGFKDFEKRFKNKMNYARTFRELVIKYPELSDKKMEFMMFFFKNRKLKISLEESYNLIKNKK